MIAVKILKPQRGLTPMSQRRVATALGLALAVALQRVGRFERVEIHAWRGVPDVEGERIYIELGNRIDIGVVDGIARRRGWDGVTVTLDGELGAVKLGIDIDIYASENVPVWAGIVERRINILAEPRGHVGGRVIESFYELFDVEHEKMGAVVGELSAEMRRVAVGERPLWRLAEAVYAMRNYGFVLEDVIPLWYRPWIRQFAKDLYKLAPLGLRELVGPYGMRRVVESIAPDLAKHLEKYYEVKLYVDAIQLIPPSTSAHRRAVADLREVLAQAMREVAGRGALRIIEERGFLDWERYVEVFGEELKRRLTRRALNGNHLIKSASSLDAHEGA
jgi:hypothetical protein